MKIRTIKTEKIVPNKLKMTQVLNKYIKNLKESSIIAITSKIVSICEGNITSIKNKDKLSLAKKEAEYFYPLPSKKYRMLLTIKNHRINFTSGIDESNSDGYFVFWPKNPQKSANEIRKYLTKRFGLKKLGVIITDTTSSPMLRGQRGTFLSHSGFQASNSYVNKKDIFGRKLRMTKAAVADALATAAVLVMGEGSEQTPIAIIEDIPFVRFQKVNPTRKEFQEMEIKIEDDLYYPLIKGVKWKKGGK